MILNRLYISRINKIRITLLSIGFSILIISYLCFQNIIQIPKLEFCGSACDWWWSFVIEFPPRGACIAVCIPRNSLYRPLFILGFIIIGIEILLEIHQVLHKYLKQAL